MTIPYYYIQQALDYRLNCLIEGIYNVHYQNIGLKHHMTCTNYQKACPAFILKSHRRHIRCITSPLPKGEEHLSNNGFSPGTSRGEKRPYISYAICKHSKHLEMFPLSSKASSTQFKLSQYSSQIHLHLYQLLYYNSIPSRQMATKNINFSF